MKALQRGFSLVTAIFLLVVLSMLAAMMTSFFSTQQQNTALDVLGSRAYQAARAGVEWAVYGVRHTPESTQWTGCSATPATLQLAGTLAPFSVAVTCIATPVKEGDAEFYFYDVSAVATGVNNVGRGNPDYVERELHVKIAR